jgi:hypothetical protein
MTVGELVRVDKGERIDQAILRSIAGELERAAQLLEKRGC